jgi:hypothetical protein
LNKFESPKVLENKKEEKRKGERGRRKGKRGRRRRGR